MGQWANDRGETVEGDSCVNDRLCDLVQESCQEL